MAEAQESNYKTRYELDVKTLGEGASCKVVKAVRLEDKKACAVKIMSKGKKVNQTMFDQETQILKKLKHPNIVRFLEGGAFKNELYIVTELVGGGELFDRIVSDDYEMTEKVVATIVKDMLQALHYLHGLNIVHRDLKPENFLFDSAAPNAKIVLIDFGTAIEVEDDHKYTDLVGTPFYLAPESATNQPSRTGRMLKSSDIWAVGVIAYICLTGTPPFYGNTNREICKAIVKHKLSFPEIDLSSGFKDFCVKCLVKRWKKRLSLDNAILHPWVIGDAASNAGINMDTIRSLRQFNNASKLKKAVSKILAQNMGEGPEKRVREHFARLDVDGNNSLNKTELIQLMRDLGFHERESEIEAQRILSEADSNDDNKIDFEEFATVWQRKLLSVNDQYIRAVFGVLDCNGDGFVTKEELMGVLDKTASKTEVEAMIAEADQNNDGKIEFLEFRRAMKEQMKTKGRKVGMSLGKQKISKGDLVEHTES